MVGGAYTGRDALDTPWLIRGERVYHKRDGALGKSLGGRPHKIRGCTFVFALLSCNLLSKWINAVIRRAVCCAADRLCVVCLLASACAYFACLFVFRACFIKFMKGNTRFDALVVISCQCCTLFVWNFLQARLRLS